MNTHKPIALALMVVAFAFFKSEAQIKEAIGQQDMQQFSFLSGKWSGEAYYVRGSI